ncbi:MAG: acetylpolyamine aminohydrolase [Spirochaetae bacterium HGW-Spirochaetae-1]|nr:MAG: acetylpolyamine aminohydrolase [Spirochaetae bacterium HGW-Spirochaetae-1]
MSVETRLIYHSRYATHYSTASCEKPDRVTSIFQTLMDHFPVIEPGPCSEDDILLCHSRGLLESEKQDSGRYEVACLSAGGAILCSELAMEGINAFGIIRPPGHHASPDQNWGFCFFNNMAIAISRLINTGKIGKAVILDIDLHFGDGTDNIFKYDNNVSVINIQSSTPREFIDETRNELKKIAEADIIGISAGFDQYEKDWGSNLSTEDYRTIGIIAGEFAGRICRGRVFSILEGGYFVPDLGLNALALIEGINGGLAM